MSKCVVRMRMPSKDTVCGMVFDLCGVWCCPVMNRICHQPDNGEIPSWCPIICSLPEGHRDLISRYAIAIACPGQIKMEDGEYWIRLSAVQESINSAPTIVPAEKSEI